MSPGSGGVRNKRSRQENGDDAGVKEEDVSDLRAFLKEEEAEIRAESRTLLNRELIARIESCKSLCDKANEHQSFPEALSSGLVAAVRQELSSCFRLGVRLESFINTYQPPRAPHPGTRPRPTASHRVPPHPTASYRTPTTPIPTHIPTPTRTPAPTPTPSGTSRRSPPEATLG